MTYYDNNYHDNCNNNNKKPIYRYDSRPYLSVTLKVIQGWFIISSERPRAIFY